MADQDPRPISNYPKPKVERPFGCLGVTLEGIGQVSIAGATAAVATIKGPLGWLLGALALALVVALIALVVWLRDQTHW